MACTDARLIAGRSRHFVQPPQDRRYGKYCRWRDYPSQRQVQAFGRPSVIVLFWWMMVPLMVALWFSFQYYSLLNPITSGFAGFDDCFYLLIDLSLWMAMANTL